MASLWKTLGYGFLVWVITFVVAILSFPLRANERPLFESIMPVVLAANVTVFAFLYLRGAGAEARSAGLRLGLIWLVVNVVLDLLLFSWGPMKMTLADYVKDIGLTYLMIPIITTGMGAAVAGESAP